MNHCSDPARLSLCSYIIITNASAQILKMGRQSCRNDNDMDDVCHPQIVKLKIKTELSCVYIKTTNLKEEILQKTEIGVEYSVPSWFQNLEINHTKEQNRPQARTILMFRTPTIKVLNSVSWVCVCVYTHTYVRTYIHTWTRLYVCHKLAQGSSNLTLSFSQTNMMLRNWYCHVC